MQLEPVTLAGRFVRLEPLAAAHQPALLRAVAGQRETFAFTFVPTPEEVPAYLAEALAAMERGEALAFATHDLRTGALVGCTRFFDLQRWAWQRGEDPRQGRGDVLDALEIGYTWLVAGAQRTPINTEAKLLMLGHAFELLGCKRVTLKTDARNQRSRDAIARLGAHFDGVLRAQQAASDGTIRDTAYFTILDSEWPAVRAGLIAKLAR